MSHRDGEIDDKVSGRVDAVNDPQPSGYRELLALQQLVNAHTSYDLNDPKILTNFPKVSDSLCRARKSCFTISCTFRRKLKSLKRRRI